MSTAFMHSDPINLLVAVAMQAKGELAGNDHSDEYYGTLPHQSDLYERIGYPNFETDWDANNEEKVDRITRLCIEAFNSKKDAKGSLLSVGDYLWINHLLFSQFH